MTVSKLPKIRSGRGGRSKTERRPKSSLAGEVATEKPNPKARSATSLGYAPNDTGIPWLDDIQRELHAEYREAEIAGAKTGMHHTFTSPFTIPSHARKAKKPEVEEEANQGALVVHDPSATQVALQNTLTGGEGLTTVRCAGRPVHMPYTPEVSANASHVYRGRGQGIGIRECQLLADACQRAGKGKMEASTYYKLGELCSQKQDTLPKAIPYFERYLNLCKRMQDKQGEAKALNCLGIVHQELGGEANLRAALRYHQAHSEVGDEAGLFIANTNMGLVHSLLGQYDNAIDCHRRAMQYAIRSGDKQAEALVLANLGLTGRAKCDYKTAQACMERHLELATSMEDAEAQRDACEQIGHLLTDKGDFVQAQRYFSNARALTHTQCAHEETRTARSGKLKCKLGYVTALSSLSDHFAEVAQRMGAKKAGEE